MSRARGVNKRKNQALDCDSRKRRNPSNEIHREPPSSSQEDEEDRFFVMEKLLDRRLNKRTGKEEFLVRWQNYSPEHDTWEPRAEIERNAMDMVRNFSRQDKACDNDQHCICRRPYKFDQGGMIQCFSCYIWYHFSCIKMNLDEANHCLRYYCDKCREKDSTFRILYKSRQAARFYSS